MGSFSKQKYKKQLLFLFFIAIVGIIFGIFVMCKSDIHYVCRGGDYGGIDLAFWIISTSLLLSLLPLFFLKEAIYHAWRRFALWYLPVAVVLISIAPASISGGMGGPIIPTDRETVSLILSAFFLIISLILIIYQSIMLRGK
ncbi:hypothetical protein AUJ44_04105 [Candidatus Nomurabacteria bacterium CG1_02_47_685]|uniref:Uncharacterized protein n=2 Tax=Parcubacteria group TaxID=1794811 RepID=A0A1J4V3L5_9BACT|nr:MAG: hypothetical protein AUJ44_04105 [Candidatus Nomurabacteria bacterium CG1_02_47_685]